ncbi:hypothetical protein AV530_005660 [Patagioenas fasciata monilis]|uniref:Uncharacterized protein n=1 Tax=Patagioenas fasciata monilis TaxID=372326 RepID=A0A1V4JM68_PATFA|nr:hypothetical protein AV530_005660 [Patagioenas fasciata monilis]
MVLRSTCCGFKLVMTWEELFQGALTDVCSLKNEEQRVTPAQTLVPLLLKANGMLASFKLKAPCLRCSRRKIMH